MKPNSSNSHPIDCLHHPGSTIHNFCTSPDCLLPMCAICVGLHSSEHAQVGTIGTFVSLQQALTSVRNELDDSCRKLEDYSQTYTNDYWNKQKMEEVCRKTIQQLRISLSRDLELTLNQLQLRLTRQIQLYDDKIHQKYRNLQDEIQYLYESIKLQQQGLSTPDKLLKNLILFHEQQQPLVITQWLHKFQQTIDNLRKQCVKVESDPQVSDNIRTAVEGIKLVEFEDTGHEMLQASSGRLLQSDRSWVSSRKDK